MDLNQVTFENWKRCDIPLALWYMLISLGCCEYLIDIFMEIHEVQSEHASSMFLQYRDK